MSCSCVSVWPDMDDMVVVDIVCKEVLVGRHREGSCGVRNSR